MTLTARASLALVALAVVVGVLLFVPARTIDYWQAWLYLAVFLGASAFTAVDLVGFVPRAHRVCCDGVGSRLALARRGANARPELPGYAEYQARVRYRLVPYLW